MKLSISEVLKRADAIKDVEKRKQFLLEHDSPAIHAIFKAAYDPKIKFLLPEGPAPYKPSDFDDLEGRLYTEMRKMYLFVEGGHPGLTKVKREQLFIDLLESVDPQDAALLVSIKDKKLPYKHITQAFVRKAYPGLIES